MTETPPKTPPPLPRLPLLEWVRQLSRDPVLGRPGRGSRSRPCQRDAGELAGARGRRVPRVCRALPQVHDRRPDAFAVPVPLRQPLAPGGQPRWRSTKQTSSRCRGPPTGTCTRTRRTSSSPLPRHCRTPPPRPRLSGPTIASFGLPYYLLVLEKVDRCTSRPLRDGVRQRLEDREARPRPASRAPVRDRHEHPCAARAVHRTRRHRALHPGHHHAAQTGSSDQGAHAGSDPAVDDERRPTTRLRQERPGVALCAPGGEDLDHGVGHLAGTRLSPAHRHGCDADDHVQPPSRRPRAPAVAGASVAASHRFRFRPAHDPVSEDLPAHAGQRPPCARQAPRPVRCRIARSSATTRTPS